MSRQKQILAYIDKYSDAIPQLTYSGLIPGNKGIIATHKGYRYAILGKEDRIEGFVVKAIVREAKKGKAFTWLSNGQPNSNAVGIWNDNTSEKPLVVPPNYSFDKPKERFSAVISMLRTSITAQPERFQGRENDFSGDTVRAIVAKGFYDNSASPIKVWWDALLDTYVVLAGHSRLTAWDELNKQGKASGRIPVIVFKGDQDDAMDYAIIESNRKSTEEGLISDLNAYRRAVKSGKSRKYLLSVFKPESKLGKLQKLMHLNPKGRFVEMLGGTSALSFPYLERNAQWIGDMRSQLPQLTNAHELELFKFIYDGGKGLKLNKDQLYKVVNDRVNRIDFDPSAALNLENRVSSSAYVDPINEEIAAVTKEIERSKKEIDQKRETIVRAKGEFGDVRKGEGAKITAPIFKRIEDLNRFILRKVEEREKLKQKAGRVERTVTADLFSEPAPSSVVSFLGNLNKEGKEKREATTSRPAKKGEYDAIESAFGPVTVYEPLQDKADYSFTYKMLSRLQSDCDYFLGAGNGHEPHLHQGSVSAQIAEMKRLWNTLPENAKPDWLSMKSILDYEDKMKKIVAKNNPSTTSKKPVAQSKTKSVSESADYRLPDDFDTRGYEFFLATDKNGVTGRGSNPIEGKPNKIFTLGYLREQVNKYPGGKVYIRPINYEDGEWKHWSEEPRIIGGLTWPEVQAKQQKVSVSRPILQGQRLPEDAVDVTNPPSTKKESRVDLWSDVELFRGGHELTEAKIKPEGISLTKNEEIGKYWASSKVDGKVFRYNLSKATKILTDIPKDILPRDTPPSHQDKERIVNHAKAKGYDGVDLSGIFSESEVRIFNLEAVEEIKTPPAKTIAPGLYIKLGAKKYEINSFEQISKVWHEYVMNQLDNNWENRDYIKREAVIYNSADEGVGRISQNGKIWLGAGFPIKNDAAGKPKYTPQPLVYDPYAEDKQLEETAPKSPDLELKRKRAKAFAFAQAQRIRIMNLK